MFLSGPSHRTDGTDVPWCSSVTICGSLPSRSTAAAVKVVPRSTASTYDTTPPSGPRTARGFLVHVADPAPSVSISAGDDATRSSITGAPIETWPPGWSIACTRRVAVGSRRPRCTAWRSSTRGGFVDRRPAGAAERSSPRADDASALVLGLSCAEAVEAVRRARAGGDALGAGDVAAAPARWPPGPAPGAGRHGGRRCRDGDRAALRPRPRRGRSWRGLAAAGSPGCSWRRCGRGA